jgi:two-component system phosphate regulon sensor histidine kinase PhoR
MCDDQSRATGVRFTVVGAGGVVLADSFHRTTGAWPPLADVELEAAMTTGKGSDVRRSHVLGGRALYVAVAGPEGGGIAAVRCARKLQLSPSASRTAAVHVGTAAVAVLGSVLAFSLVLDRRIAIPLRQLENGTAELASGNLKAPLPACSSVEMDRLAGAINAMAEQLASRLAAVRSEHHELEAIVSSMIEGVMAVDQEQRVFKVNHAVADMLGVAESDLLGKRLENALRNTALAELVASTLAANEPVEGEVTLFGREDRILSIHGTQLFGDEDSRNGAVIVFNDITRIRRLEMMRRQFASNVSHELKTPITSIQGFVETLLDGTLEESPEDVRHFLEIILNQTKRLNAIMEDILLLSRVEQGRAEFAKGLERVSTDEVVMSALEQCRNKAEEKGIVLLAECPESFAIEAHPRLLEQALVNLLTNAINYSPQGETVTVRASVDDEGVKLNVIDNGTGISRDHIPRLFERFYRVDKARSRQLGGTGLGLAIVKHIVTAHAGFIDVASEIGKGSTFTITLPSQAKGA